MELQFIMVKTTIVENTQRAQTPTEECNTELVHGSSIKLSANT